MRPVPSLTRAADELIELRLMRDTLRQELDMSEFASVGQITAAAVGCIRRGEGPPLSHDHISSALGALEMERIP